jgi:hypothetical protein
MDYFKAINKLLPNWCGAVWNNSYEGIKPDVSETRPTPTLAELEAVWPEVEAELILEKKRSAYKVEADPLFLEYQALLATEHEDAESKRQEWLAKREEIKTRFE